MIQIIIIPIGVILDYTISIRDMYGTTSSFTSSTESTVISSLDCCTNYTYQVVARTSAGLGTPSHNMSWMINAIGKSKLINRAPYIFLNFFHHTYIK